MENGNSWLLCLAGQVKVNTNFIKAYTPFSRVHFYINFLSLYLQPHCCFNCTISQPHHLLTFQPWASSLASLYLSFLICEVG